MCVTYHIHQKNQKFINTINSKLSLTTNTKEEIIQDFTDLISKIDINTPADEINNKMADIIKRVRKLYGPGRDE